LQEHRGVSARTSDLLARPIETRRLEFKYRCAQAVIFGLPVLGLQYFGARLGGAESVRWVAILQAVLGGWVVYVAAAGMFFEGILTLSRGVAADLVVSTLAIAAYLWSLGSVLAIFMTGNLGYEPLLFHLCVMLLAVWSGLRWWRLVCECGRVPPQP
jgi:hypothetical protein